MGSEYMETSIVIPAFNEAENIGQLLITLNKLRDEVEILVVNDGSNDRTAELVASAGIKVLNLPENNGKSYAMLQGLNN
ncbi:MAG TPA: glycosyltransferase, partial [Bacillota bacterium]|nr:glycosyltransferase [Bacillota bacterium]